MAGRPPGSSVHGILLARILEWVAISSSRGSFWPRDQTHVSCGSCIGRQILYHWCSLGPWPNSGEWHVWLTGCLFGGFWWRFFCSFKTIFMQFFADYLFYVYLFIWLYQGLTVACRIFLGAHRLSSCGEQVSRSDACKISVPLPGMKPLSSALQDGFLTTGPPGKSPFAP